MTDLDTALAEHKVVVVSKTYCPFCTRVKGLLGEYSIKDMVVLEADKNPSAGYQERATELTGSRTVPQVFIAGKPIGGCDDTQGLHSSGKLKELLTEAGAI